MIRVFAFLFAVAIATGPALAEPFRVVQDQSSFLGLVNGKHLTRFGIKLNVSSAGGIRGDAFGRPVTGRWRWENGFFCRDLFWGQRDLGPNCQRVTVRGNTIRFYADRGEGIYADFRMQ